MGTEPTRLSVLGVLERRKPAGKDGCDMAVCACCADTDTAVLSPNLGNRELSARERRSEQVE